MAIKAAIVFFILGTRRIDRHTTDIALCPGMAIGAISGQGHSEGMIFAAVFHGKEAMTGVAFSTTAITGGD